MGGKKKCSVLSRSPSTVIVKNNNCFIFFGTQWCQQC